MASVSRPERAGCGEGTNLPDRWSAEENIAWKRDVPGRGWSSPIVWGSRVFLTTVSPVNNGGFLLATAAMASST